MVREHTEKVKPPRALFVPFPFGHALGRPTIPRCSTASCARRSISWPSQPGPSCATSPTMRSPATSRPHRRRPRGSRPRLRSGRSRPGDDADAPVPRAVAGPKWRPHRLRSRGHSGHALPRGDPLSPELRRRRRRRHGRARARRATAGLHPLVRGRSEVALLRGAHGDEAIGGWRRDRAVVLGRDGGGPAPAPRGQRLDASDDPRWKAAAFGVAR